MATDDSVSLRTGVHLSHIDSRWNKAEGKLSCIQWGLTTLRCVLSCLCIVVLVCEWCSKLSICSISDGLRDVISHSVLVLIKWPSRHGSPTKASTPPSQRSKTDRPIRAGRCDMQSAVITALRGEEPDRGHHTPARSQQDPSPNKHDEPKPLEVMTVQRVWHPHSSFTCATCHQERLAVTPIEGAVRQQVGDCPGARFKREV